MSSLKIIWNISNPITNQNEPHPTAQRIKKYYTNEEQWDEYFKFAIVRNPFDKIVSSYNFICRDIKPCNFRDRMLFKDFIFRKNIFKNILDPNLEYQVDNYYHHFITSTKYLYDNDNNLLVDHVGKFEDLENEWIVICEKLKIKIKLPHINKFNRENKSYRDYYDYETKTHISKIFKKDLETFGYEF